MYTQPKIKDTKSIISAGPNDTDTVDHSHNHNHNHSNDLSVNGQFPAWFQDALITLPPDVAARAKSELNEIADTRLQHLWDLRCRVIKARLMFGVPGSGKAPTDEWLDECSERDVFLMAFLRTSKFNVYRAFDRVSRYCTILEELDINLADTTWAKSRDVLETGLNMMLPSSVRDKKGRAISVFTMRNMKGISSTAQLMNAMLAAMAPHLLDEITQVNGVITIDDIEGVSGFGFGSLSGGVDMQPILKLVKEGLPFRLKKIIVLHPTWLFNFLYAVIKPFMKKKVLNRVAILPSVEMLTEYIAVENIPKTLGGKLDFHWNGPDGEIKRMIESEGSLWHDREFLQIVVDNSDLGNVLSSITLCPHEESNGVLISAADADGVASKLNIKQNDIIFEVDDAPVHTTSDVFKGFQPVDWLGRSKEVKDVTLLIRRVC